MNDEPSEYFFHERCNKGSMDGQRGRPWSQQRSRQKVCVGLRETQSGEITRERERERDSENIYNFYFMR